MKNQLKVDHLEYDINEKDRASILRYINMEGGDEVLKQELIHHSPDEIDAKNLAEIDYQMTHELPRR